MEFLKSHFTRSTRWLFALMFSVTALNAAAPVIDSELTDTAVVGEPYEYTITATEDPTGFASGTLPPGLSRTGAVISGTPTDAGSYTFFIYAENADGDDTEDLDLVISDEKPVITSPTTASGNAGAPFEYVITADNNPTSFSADGLNAFPGLSLDDETGVISGIPLAEASGELILRASNGAGDSVPQSLNLTIGPVAEAPPVIFSPLNADATVGTPFSYTIEATNLPFYSIGGDPLPDGLSFANNVISGTPNESGTFNIVLNAVNSDGADSETLELKVNDALPVITSPFSESGLVGEFFTYTITATNNPTSFNVEGLAAFPGLSFNSETGVISGTPTAVAQGGLFIEAINAGGSGSAIISLSFSTSANLAPRIISSRDRTTTVGDFFSYMIQATNSPLVYGISGDDLPEGLSRSGNMISGYPTEIGEFEIEISATNSFGTDTETLRLEVVEPRPEIISLSSAVGEVGENFEYQIVSSTSVDSYSAIGLETIGGLTLDSNTGLISGKPTKTGSFDILLQATNSAGIDRKFLTIFILDSVQGDGPTVNVVSINGESPTSNPELDNTATSLDFVVEVTPVAGETLETVFVQWTNVPSTLGFNSVVVAELQPQEPIPATGPVTYTGTAAVGFDPTNREIGGGEIALEVVATQRNADSELSFGTSDEAMVVIEPLVKFLLPEEGVSQESIPAGGTFAAVRLSTNAFKSISASISGVGTIESVVDDNDNDNQNGVFTFDVSSEISFPDTYVITVRVEDSIGNIVEITRNFEIVNDTSSPVVVIANPTPGFRNDVFSPGSFTWLLDDSQFERNDEGDITKSTYTYLLESVSRGQGYFPRNKEDARLFYSFYDEAGFYAGSGFVNGNSVVNGRVIQVAETVVFNYRGFVPAFGLTGIGLVDNSSDPGIDSRIEIVADLFKADADLQSFSLFINGDDVTPGSGNLNPASGPISVPVFTYPRTGSLTPGEYVVTAEVTDQNGEVGVSRPLVFTIDPFEELEVNLTSESGAEVNQGDTVTYLVEVMPADSLDSVEIFDSLTSESLGLASRVTIDGQVFYRFTRTYEEAGSFSLYALATTFSGQQVASNQLSGNVLSFNDAEVSITSPEENTNVILGSSITFSAEASATPGIESITWSVNNTPIRTVPSSTASFVFASGTQAGEYPLGTYTITASAVDNFGNEVGSNESIVVSVVGSDITVSISTANEEREVVEGEQLTFNATVSSSVGVGSVEWYLGETLVQTDTETPYSFTNGFPSSGEFSVRAEAVDTLGNRSTSSSINVTVNPPNPLLRNEDFVTSIYNSLIGRVPNTGELESALNLLDDSLDSRVGLVADLLNSDDTNAATSVPIIYRTMTGEWPGPDEIDQAQEDLYGEGSRTETREGTILLFNRQSFNIDIPAGARVTASVRSGDEGGLTDPILTVYSPFGRFVAYDDDSGPGLFPELTFSAFEGGNHSFIVDGWGSSVGSFVLEVEIFGDAGQAENPSALTLALLPEYESRFGVRDEALPFIRQLFENKHGSAPSALSEVRLLNSATGDTIEYDTREIPGYSENLDAYAAGFALDNQTSALTGPSGLPLTTVHLYESPNNPVAEAGIALLVSGFLGENPTDTMVNSFASSGLEQAIERILTDRRYYSQFPTNTIQGEVAQYLADAGIFNLSQNGLDDDPDGDGATNEEEFNAGTGPNDASDTPDDTASAWYAGAGEGDNGWRYFDWFNWFQPLPSGWTYHARHGWLYVVAEDTSSLFLWDGALERWMFTNETVYPWMYAFGSNGGWVYFFEGGSPGARFFERGDTGEVISEEELRESP